jgi:hypothetical protein
LLLYRAAVFFLMIPLLAERSITENVVESSAEAVFTSLAVKARRIARIWCRRRDLFLRLTSVRRSVCRTRLSAEYVFAIFAKSNPYRVIEILG